MAILKPTPRPRLWRCSTMSAPASSCPRTGTPGCTSSTATTPSRSCFTPSSPRRQGNRADPGALIEASHAVSRSSTATTSPRAVTVGEHDQPQNHTPPFSVLTPCPPLPGLRAVVVVHVHTFGATRGSFGSSLRERWSMRPFALEVMLATAAARPSTVRNTSSARQHRAATAGHPRLQPRTPTWTAAQHRRREPPTVLAASMLTGPMNAVTL